MKTNNYQRVATALAKIGFHINEDYFKSALPTPIITIQESARCYGHFTVSRVWKVNDDNAYEINVSANYLSRPIEEVVTTMIHEYVHMYCMVNGIKDTSNNGVYHNKKFKEIAETMGHIEISQANTIGWSVSRPTEETIEFCIRHNIPDISINRGGYVQTDYGDDGKVVIIGKDGAKNKVPKKTSHHIKYKCGCGQIVTATKEMHAMCLNCGCLYERMV